MEDRTVKLLSKVHATAFRLTGGIVGRRLVRNDMLLLTTTGQKSGRDHTVPLLYLADDDSYIVIASYGGRPHHPQWYLNLKSHPAAVVQIAGARFDVAASVMSEAARERWWPMIVEAYSDYAVYQARTSRIIPVVRLNPSAPMT